MRLCPTKIQQLCVLRHCSVSLVAGHQVTGGRRRVIPKEGWCETEWKVCVCLCVSACALDGSGVTYGQVLAKPWRDQTECLSSMVLHPSTRPQGWAVGQPPSSLYPSPSLSHPFVRKILSTHPSIRHIKDTQKDTRMPTHRFTHFLTLCTVTAELLSLQQSHTALKHTLYF